jgi:hypothetical protein
MSGSGSIILVGYGEENMFLSENPQISYFKIIYRRYTNFSIETILTNFLYKPNFGNKYTAQLSKYADLLHKAWLCIELPAIPIILDLEGNPDSKLKTAWARKIGYNIIDYIEFVIGNLVIQKTWGEYLNALDEYNTTNFNSSMDQYIGNVPELITFQSATTIRPSYTLYIPLQFWFCLQSSQALPLISLEYSDILINVNFNTIEQCLNYSPTNYIELLQFYGQGIFNEPLIQYSTSGVAQGTFDSLDLINDPNNENYTVTNYNLYYRKISNSSFVTTDISYYNNYSYTDILNNYLVNGVITDYFIYGVWSNSLFIPISNNNKSSNNIENTYFYRPISNKLSLIDTYLLIDYVFLDKVERMKFFNNKHEYIIEQVYYSGNTTINNLNAKINIEIINPCKFMIFMAQLSYLNNPNVNDSYNYTNSFVRNPITDQTIGITVIKELDILLNSQSITNYHIMDFYNILIPFLKFPMCHYPNGLGMYSFSLYPLNTQQSGTCNMSSFANISFIVQFNSTDLNNNNYIFKSYAVTTNVLKIIHGIGSTVFYSNY